jgi:hypothetical protein
MKSLTVFILILAVFFTTMILTPIVSAEDVVPSTTLPPMSAPNISAITVPQLQFDPSQEKITITRELSPEQKIQPTSTGTGSTSTKPIAKSSSRTSISTPTVPYGAIIHHANNGVTTVFDKTGRQLFATDDINAATVTTPQNEAPATFVHEIPSGSIATESQGKTYVFYNGNLILTLINENTGNTQTTTQTTTPTPTQVQNPRKIYTTTPAMATATISRYKNWIEYAESTAITADRFESTWTAPTKTPVNSGVKESLAIFNGIQQSGTDGIMQPVLMWNFCATGDETIHNEYKGAAWDYQSSGSIDTMHSTPIAVSPGDTVTGTIQWSSTLNCWLIQFKNINSDQTTAFYTTRFPRDNLVLYMALESTAAGVKKSTDSLTGPITFGNNIIKYQGSDVSTTFTGHTYPGASSAFTGLSTSVTTNPLKVTLETGR